MTINNKMHSILKEIFNIDSFRSSQEAVIEKVINGENCLVLMPTGKGKSLCYQLPALALDGLTVVMSPLIALMKDQVDGLKKRGIDAEYINSSLSKPERLRRYQNVRDGKYKLLFVAPERFKNDDFIAVINTRNVSLLAIDEAHCASQWGNDFRPDYSRLAEFRGILGNPVTIALTATATRKVQDDIIEKLGFAREDISIFNEGISRPNLHLSVSDVLDEEEKYTAMLKLVKSRTGSAIIYFNLIKSLESFARFLDMKKISYSMYHGKLEADRRRSVQKRFNDADDILMLATNAFGMGIDKPDIRMIIHAEIPDSVEAYYQEIGRSGRDGKHSDAVLMYNEADLAVQMDFLEWKNPGASFIKAAYVLMEKLGGSLISHTYEDLQEQLVYKNKGDHRLQTVLSLFDRFNVTSGRIDLYNLKLTGSLPEHLVNEEMLEKKNMADRERLYAILQYVKTTHCRREHIHNYFDLPMEECGTCDLCDTEK